MTQFSDLGLAAPLMGALAAQGYENPTPIQAKAIPQVMAGHDVLGIAQTGTGKTAAFALPILHHLITDPARPPHRGCRVLVLSPTRELASQIANSFRALGAGLKLNVATVFGGVPAGAQIRALARGLDVLVATPGRLVDHLDSGAADLRGTEVLVLDEVDQMLDLGFVKPIRRIVRDLSSRRQNLFFSATMPNEIRSLATELLKEPVEVSVAPVSSTVERVTQEVLLVEASRKREVLVGLFAQRDMRRAIVFTRTKHGADRVARNLEQAGIAAQAIHGNKSQSQRERALAAFRAGTAQALVATDVAARGIDIDGVTHVINFEMPDVAERYVHRIGRTARAGADGVAISLCDNAERDLLRGIEKLTRQHLPTSDLRRPDARNEAVAAAPTRAKGPRPGARKPKPPRRKTPPTRTAAAAPARDTRDQGLAGIPFMSPLRRKRAG